MRRLAAIALLFLLSACRLLHAQPFWLTAYEFPGGPKTALAGLGDSCLLAGLANGILRSTDGGEHWSPVLQSSFIFSLHARPGGLVLAGGAGRIFVSPDAGQHWDSVLLDAPYPVAEFAHTPDGALFACTSGLDPLLGYVGAGVYRSADGGLSWSRRNTGLGGLSCDQLAADAEGRIYTTVRDELASGAGGLYVSSSQGLNWTQIPIRIDGQGVIVNEIQAIRAAGLYISPQDSLYISLEGVADNVAVQLNLCKALGDLHRPGFWRRIQVLSSPAWWMDWLLQDMHQARNGDLYSSLPGSLAMGGTWYRPAGGAWDRYTAGLGLDAAGLYSPQQHYELSNGRIFMIQYLDERIYKTDKSRLLTGGGPPDEMPRLAYPNPARAGEWIYLPAAGRLAPDAVFLTDLQGRRLPAEVQPGMPLAIRMPGTPGMCLLHHPGGVQRILIR
ncbi:MAG: hypothetical protein NW241_20140 [Bacteroidia bacterium]|nr:hypothetical protein [Bacteroidia bacterium]